MHLHGRGALQARDALHASTQRTRAVWRLRHAKRTRGASKVRAGAPAAASMSMSHVQGRSASESGHAVSTLDRRARVEHHSASRGGIACHAGQGEGSASGGKLFVSVVCCCAVHALPTRPNKRESAQLFLKRPNRDRTSTTRLRSYSQGVYMRIVKVPPQIADLRREVLAVPTVVRCPVFAPVKSVSTRSFNPLYLRYRPQPRK